MASAAPAVPGADSPATPGALVIMGTGGVSVEDLSPDATPNLWALFRHGSAAVMTLTAAATATCPVDGWLSLGAGARVTVPRGESTGSPSPCPPVVEPVRADSRVTVAGWPAAEQAARESRASLGVLGERLGRAPTCVQAIGPGAAIAAARPDGTVARYAPFATDTLLEDLAACPVTIVDVGAARGPDLAPGEPPAVSREEQLSRIDNRVGEVIAAGPNGADYLVLSMADAGTEARLRVALARGPRFGPGMLESLSTRQPGLIQAADVTATAIWLENHALPDGVAGRPLATTAALDASEVRAGERLSELVDLGLAAARVHELVGPFFWTYGVTTVAFFTLSWLWWLWRRGRMTEAGRLRYLDVVEFLALWTACVPAATFLAGAVPWWRFAWPLPALVGTVAVISGAVALVAQRGPWRRHPLGSVGIVAGLTALTIAVDVMSGSRLQLLGLMGLQPVGGGRFYGMGNVAFALFATATILVAAVLAGLLLQRRQRTAAVGTVAVLALLALAVDGLPFWGADAGGPPALVAGFAILLYAVRERALTWRQVAATGGVALLLVVAVGVLDWLRPQDQRTHLGDYVQRVIDGTASQVIRDKAAANLAILSGADQPLAPLVPVVLLALLAAVALPDSRLGRPLRELWRASRVVRAGVLSVLVCLLVGMLINDSGVAVAAAAAPLLLPWLIALQLRVLHGDERGQASTRAGRRGRAR